MSMAALYQALRLNLANASPIWADRAYADIAPAGVTRPYVVWFAVSGGRDLVRQDVQSASYVVTVKCVADTLALSLAGQEAIRAVLDDNGTQDRRNTLVQPTGWRVHTITADRAVHVVERFEGAQAIYHDGYQYSVVMEAV